MLQRKPWRLRALAAASLAGLLLLPAELAAAAPAASDTGSDRAGTAARQDDRPAGAAQPQVIKTRLGIGQGTLNKLRTEAREDRAAGKGAARPTGPDTPQPSRRPDRQALAEPKARTLGLADAERMSRATAAAHPQPGIDAQSLNRPALTAAAPIGEQPDANVLRDCFNGPDVETGIGQVLNRFSYCTRVELQAEYWSVDARGVPVEKEGTTTAKLEVFTQGDDQNRRARVFARFQPGSVEYDWGPVDNLFVAPNVPMSLIGQCSQDGDVCHATRGPVTMPWTTWDNNQNWFYWDVYNHEEAAQGRDRIAYNQWFVEAYTDTPQYKTLKPGRTDPRMLRCDSATYFSKGQAQYPKACVFSEATPRLNYRLASDYRSVAQHIYEAQYHPDTTYPLLAPPNVPAPRAKRIPGRYESGNPDAPGLHRITEALHPGEYAANGQHKDGACFKTGPVRHEYLDTGLPAPPGAGEQCDEYPFASTLEGAGHPYWDFSVKAVPQPDNSVAGGLLRSYYVDDRILAWDAGLPDPDATNDRFYVHIE